MMRNNLQAFENGLNSDLDLDATQDFVNQAGSFSMDNLLSEFSQYGQQGSGVTAESLTTGAGAAQATSPEAVKNQALLEKRRNKGKGSRSICKGIREGLGTFGRGPTATAITTTNTSHRAN